MRAFYHIDSMHKTFDHLLSPPAVDRIIRYNFGVDFYGIVGWKFLQKKVFPLYPLARYWYKRIDHIDQTESVEETLEMFRLHIQRIFETIDDEMYPLPATEPVFRILGRSTHGISDIFSHSNLMELIFDYHRQDPAASEAALASGKPLHTYIGEDAPVFAALLDDPAHENFRKNYLPNLFTLTSLPDTGPRCHEQRNLDCPSAPGSINPDYPSIFEAAYRLSLRELRAVIDTYFARLAEENPEKHKLLTGAYRAPGLQPGPGPAEIRAKWWCDKLGVWS